LKKGHGDDHEKHDVEGHGDAVGGVARHSLKNLSRRLHRLDDHRKSRIRQDKGQGSQGHGNGQNRGHCHRDGRDHQNEHEAENVQEGLPLVELDGNQIDRQGQCGDNQQVTDAQDRLLKVGSKGGALCSEVTYEQVIEMMKRKCPAIKSGVKGEDVNNSQQQTWPPILSAMVNKFLLDLCASRKYT
jgi:hypothetical protein